MSGNYKKPFSTDSDDYSSPTNKTKGSLKPFLNGSRFSSVKRITSKHLASVPDLRIDETNVAKKHWTKEAIEEALIGLSSEHKNLVKEYSYTFTAEPVKKQLAFLTLENKQLRTELCRLNEFLTHLVEYRRGTHLSTIPVKEVNEITDKEISSLSKQLKEAENEYIKLKARLEQIQDPKYLADLKERVVSLSLKMKKIEKNKKKIEVSQRKQDKLVEPEFSKAENAAVQELAQIESKIKENEGKITRQALILQDQTGKTADVKAHWKKTAEEARMIGLETSEVTGAVVLQKVDKASEQEAKLANLEKTLNLLKTRYNVAAGEYAQKKAQLQGQICGAAESLQKKSEQSFKKKEELAMVVNKSKSVCSKVIDTYSITPRNKLLPGVLSQSNLEMLKSARKEVKNEATTGYVMELEVAKTREQAAAKKIQKAWKLHLKRVKRKIGAK